MRILNFGSCNIDIVYSVEHILRPGETISAKGVSTFPGGKGLNQSIALARAGADVFHAGCIGTDGSMLMDCMRQCGVDLRYMRTADDKTGHAIIQVDSGGENGIVIYSGANGRITKEHMDLVISDFAPGDFLIAQNEINDVPYLISRAARQGLQVVFNPSPFNDSIKEVDLKDVSYLILNEVEAAGLWGTAEPGELLPILEAKHPGLKVVLTLGKRGSVYFEKGRMIRQSAYTVEIVDTTAAGDTFTGYLFAGIARGQDMKTAMRYASAASAITVSLEGASVSIPSLDEVEKILPELRPSGDDSVAAMIHMAKAFFEKYYPDGTLEMLAKELGYSRSYTSTWLQANLGASFTELLQRRKCAAAAEYLENTALSVTEIIQRVGYRNESFFRKKFVQRYGCTPLKYRQRSEHNYG